MILLVAFLVVITLLIAVIYVLYHELQIVQHRYRTGQSALRALEEETPSVQQDTWVLQPPVSNHRLGMRWFDYYAERRDGERVLVASVLCIGPTIPQRVTKARQEAEAIVKALNE